MKISKELKNFIIDNKELIDENLEDFYKLALKRLETLQLVELANFFEAAGISKLNMPSKMKLFQKVIGQTGTFIGGGKSWDFLKGQRGKILDLEFNYNYDSRLPDKENYENCYWLVEFQEDEKEIKSIHPIIGKAFKLDNPIK